MPLRIGYLRLQSVQAKLEFSSSEAFPPSKTRGGLDSHAGQAKISNTLLEIIVMPLSLNQSEVRYRSKEKMKERPAESTFEVHPDAAHQSVLHSIGVE